VDGVKLLENGQPQFRWQCDAELSNLMAFLLEGSHVALLSRPFLAVKNGFIASL